MPTQKHLLCLNPEKQSETEAMHHPQEMVQPLTYCIVIAGVILTAITAMAPLPNGAYILSFSFLLLGITPYIIYASFSGILESHTQVITGIALLTVDFSTRIGFHITNTANANHLYAIYLCLILILLVIPAGIVVGRLASKLMSE